MYKHIRPITQNDFEQYRRISNSSEDIAKYVPGLVIRKFEDQQKLFNHKYLVFAVCTDDGSLAGLIHATKEVFLHGLNVACFLGKNFRKKGLMYQTWKNLFSIVRLKLPTPVSFLT